MPNESRVMRPHADGSRSQADAGCVTCRKAELCLFKYTTRQQALFSVDVSVFEAGSGWVRLAGYVLHL